MDLDIQPLSSLRDEWVVLGEQEHTDTLQFSASKPNVHWALRHLLRPMTHVIIYVSSAVLDSVTFHVNWLLTAELHRCIPLLSI